jgi:hypothetical protein
MHAENGLMLQIMQSASAKKQKGERQKVVDAINEVFDKFQGRHPMLAHCRLLDYWV